MNFTYPLDHILGQLSKIKILRFLAKARVPMNGREMGKAVGLSHVRCHAALKELSEQGIVSLRRIGRSIVYELQQDHIVVRHWLKPLFREEGNIKSRLAQTIASRLTVKPASIIIFGSIAKKQDRPGSDIDVLIIMPHDVNLKKCRAELTKAEEMVTQLYGNHLSPLIMKLPSLNKKVRKGDRFIKNILNYGQPIYGKTIAELMTDES